MFKKFNLDFYLLVILFILAIVFNVWWAASLLLIAGLSNAIMDTIRYHNSKNSKYWLGRKLATIKNDWWRIFFSKKASSNGKYIDGDPSKGRIKWTLAGGLIKFNKPVQLIDAWHFLKMVQLTAWVITLAINLPFIIFTSDWVIWFNIAIPANEILSVFIWGTLRNSSFNILYDYKGKNERIQIYSS